MKDNSQTAAASFCKSFGKCGSCTLDMSYEEQKLYKLSFVKKSFSSFYDLHIEFFSSPHIHYRNRAEFGLYHDNGNIYYTMGGVDKRVVFIDECKKVDAQIYNIMPTLLTLLKQNQALSYRVFGVEFISTSSDLFIILLYHKDISLIEDELRNLQNTLKSENQKISLIARSRGKKLLFSKEFLTKTLYINYKEFIYNFGYSAFIQPNTKINQSMISWVLKAIDKTSSKKRDLLEMYCGYGNFTIPLSSAFRKVLATEISKESISFAKQNSKNNDISNITFVRISSEELMKAFDGEKFYRLRQIELGEFDFSTVLVDPPRAGLDDSVLEFIKNYKHIIYISCNPTTLKQNLKSLSNTHKVVKMALFDQFVHTNHIEMGLVLEKIY